ncbi:hypothetical protein LLEC1_08145 [Akanthomyces lecanii]|uniref:Uncharacterized protein n=1 Tax=Cordyceps confragosa TaxID=2714763 RepID=A0A179IAP4_CORDF|nr:hypothetical protein LLEC1_08145 [Akanthomyces lecanii]
MSLQAPSSAKLTSAGLPPPLLGTTCMAAAAYHPPSLTPQLSPFTPQLSSLTPQLLRHSIRPVSPLLRFERTRKLAILCNQENKEPAMSSSDATDAGGQPNQRELSATDYTVGWICAVPVEYAAAIALLDEQHGRTDNTQHEYTLGKMAGHNVAIAMFPVGEKPIS